MKAFSAALAALLLVGLVALVQPAGAQTAPAPCKAGKASPRTDKATGVDPAVLKENLAKARAFMAENGKQPGVVKLKSGAQYKVITSAESHAQCANPELRLRVHYEGTLPDGTVFDTSMNGAPAIFRLTELVRGWQEVVPMMRIGDEWMIYLPPELGYGEKGTDKVPPNSPIIFKMKLLGMLG